MGRQAHVVIGANARDRVSIPVEVVGLEGCIARVNQRRCARVRIDEANSDVETILALELLIDIKVIHTDVLENRSAFLIREVFDLERDDCQDQHGEHGSA